MVVVVVVVVVIVVVVVVVVVVLVVLVVVVFFVFSFGSSMQRNPIDPIQHANPRAREELHAGNKARTLKGQKRTGGSVQRDITSGRKTGDCHSPARQCGAKTVR